MKRLLNLFFDYIWPKWEYVGPFFWEVKKTRGNNDHLVPKGKWLNINGTNRKERIATVYGWCHKTFLDFKVVSRETRISRFGNRPLTDVEATSICLSAYTKWYD